MRLGMDKYMTSLLTSQYAYHTQKRVGDDCLRRGSTKTGGGAAPVPSSQNERQRLFVQIARRCRKNIQPRLCATGRTSSRFLAGESHHLLPEALLLYARRNRARRVPDALSHGAAN